MEVNFIHSRLPFIFLINYMLLSATVNHSLAADKSEKCSPHHRGFESFTANDILVSLSSSQIDGEIPSDLNVAIYYNGPGRNENKGEPYCHWFDGDALVTKILVSGKLGEIQVRSRS